MRDPDERTRTRLARRAGVPSLVTVAACALAFGLTGCRTTGIGEPEAIRIPQNLSEAEGQRLVVEFLEGKLPRSRRSGRVRRKQLGRWQIESWEPGSLVAAYAWGSHILRMNIAFADRTTVVEIGDSENLHQSARRIHKRAKALAMELVQDVRYAYARAAMAQQTPGRVAHQSAAAAKPSFCRSRWGDDPRERASCQRAQQRSYDRLRPLVAQAEAGSTTVDSRRIRACYATTQTGVGADWESIERCFYAPPASAR